MRRAANRSGENGLVVALPRSGSTGGAQSGAATDGVPGCRFGFTALNDPGLGWRIETILGAFEPVLGYSRSDLALLNLTDIIDPADRGVFNSAAGFVETESRFFMELRLRAASGRRVWTRVEAIPLRDGPGDAVASIVGVVESLPESEAPGEPWCCPPNAGLGVSFPSFSRPRAARSACWAGALYERQLAVTCGQVADCANLLRTELQQSLPLDGMKVLRWDSASELAQLEYHWLAEGSRRRPPETEVLDGSVCGEALRLGRSIHVNARNVTAALRAYPRYREMYARTGGAGLIAVPLDSRGVVVGAVVMRSSFLGAFSEADAPRAAARELTGLLHRIGVPGRIAAGIQPGDLESRSEEAIAGRARAEGLKRPVGGPQVLKIGGLSMDSAKRTATVGGAPLMLSRIEYALLLELVRSEGGVVERDELLRRVWGSEYWGENRYLTVYVARLRSKLREHLHAGARIETVRGVGYRLSETAQGMFV